MRTILLSLSLLFFCSALSAAEPQDTTIVVPETGCLPIKASRNFTGPADVVVCSLFGSKSSGMSFTQFRLDTVIVASSSNSSSGLFLVAKPGAYTLTLTDDEVTGKIFSTSVNWQQEAGQAYKKGRLLYKFVNELGRVGFQRDEKYAAESYQYCDMAEGEHIYLPLAENSLNKIAELMEVNLAELSFIPWDGPWKNVPTLPEASGIDELPLDYPLNSHAIFDLQGRRIQQPTKGIFVSNGKKYIK